ncbi:MAG: hypothetical protein SAJ37_12970 [Oscillatoria sp. PMC 1068.18]|nr:hypothetical protein [Oscillatoria sp. PMC 1076.18]MEC4989634.1 hypothetical protein [Oscillatoria sp. PMC 1068.18]
MKSKLRQTWWKKLVTATIVTTTSFGIAGNAVAQSANNYLNRRPSIKKGSFICLNNPNPTCENTFRDLGEVKKGKFNCVSNPNPTCGNPFRDLGERRPGRFICINNPNPVCNNPPRF